MTNGEEKQDVIVATSQVDGTSRPSRTRFLQTWGKPLGTAAWQAALAAVKNKAEIEDVAKADPANIQQCENLSGEIKQTTCAELVRTIADYSKSGSDGCFC